MISIRHWRPTLVVLSTLAALTCGASFASTATPLTMLGGHIVAAAKTSAFVGKVAETTPLTVEVVLPLRDQAAMQDQLKSIYTPGSANYGKYLTGAQFTALYGPTQDDYDAVATYFASKGLSVSQQTPTRTLLQVSGSTAAIQNALNVQINKYQTPSGRAFIAPATEPVLPSVIASKIVGVAGLSTFNQLKPHYVKGPSKLAPFAYVSHVGSGIDGDIAPNDIRIAYGLQPTNNYGDGQVIASVQLDGYDPADITAYWNQYKSVLGTTQPPLVNVLVDGADGTPSGTGGEVEVCLDIEMQMALAPNVKAQYVYMAPNAGMGLTDCFQRAADDNVAKSISCSWGSTEYYWTAAEITAANQAFAQMAFQGQSVFAASGDDGAFDDKFNPTVLSVDMPAALAMITGVGGTTLTLTPSLPYSYSSETTWGDFATQSGGGGGVSQITSNVWYQANATVTNPQASPIKRNVPDVSLNADPKTGYSIYADGSHGTVGGTSAASPLWAAFATLVNTARAAKGLGTLGFANPALYAVAGNTISYANDFHDIKDQSTNLHFTAVAGYDLATGLGSFNGQNLIADLIATTPPSPPTNVTANYNAPNVVLTWDSMPGATGYNVYRSLSPNTGYILVGSSPTIQFLDQYPGTVGGDFYYKVTSTNPAESAPTSASPFPRHVPVPPPTITSLAPTNIDAGSPTFSLRVNGTNFYPGCVVNFGSTPLSTTYVSANQLQAVVTATQVANPGTAGISVNNFGESGLSNIFTFTINNPSPTVKTVNPTKVIVNSEATVVTITGTGFYQSSQVYLNSSIPLTTTVVSPTVITATLPKSNLSTRGTLSLSVLNPISPAPGGSSGTISFVVDYPTPVLSSLQVMSSTGVLSAPFVGAGAGQFTLVINGTGFVGSASDTTGNSSIVNWTPHVKGATATPLNITVLTPTSIQALVTPDLVTSGGQFDITVVNPTIIAGAGISGPLTFVVTNPVPTLNSLTDTVPGMVPSSVGAGSSDITVTFTGSNFVYNATTNAGPVISFGGTTYASTFVNPTELTLLVPASALAIGGDELVTVSNQAPGGGQAVDPTTGNPQTLHFTIMNQIPIVASISPATANSGDNGKTITITGSNFVPTSTANLDGGSLATTYVSPTQLTAFVPTATLSFAHDASLTVVTGLPGGGTSNSVTLSVNNPAPVLATPSPLSPVSIATGSGPTQVTISGSKFMSTCSVLVNGTAIKPDSVTSTSSTSTILVTIPASYFVADTTLTIQVSNPTPGGGVTGTASIAVATGLPSVTTISPTKANVNSQAFTLTVTGTAFVPAATVLWNGTPLATTYVNSTQLTAAVTSDLLATAGSATVTVQNSTTLVSSPGLPFTINNTPPTILAISPSTLPSGSADFTLTVTGLNFAPGATVNFNGTTLTPDATSTTSALTVTVPAAQVAKAGTASVYVTNPTPGGGQSAQLPFIITAAYSYPTGLHMISAPYDYSALGKSFVDILGLTSPKIAVWQPGISSYAVATAYPADTFRLGQGYWARFVGATPLLVVGSTLTAKTFNVSLPAGWNQIGDPYPGSINLASVLVYDLNGVRHTWAEATSSTLALVSPVIYTYNMDTNSYVAHSVGSTTEANPTIDPFQGYWLLANQSVRLQYAAP